MNKKEFKKEYSKCRLIQAQFEQRLKSLPCGADDAACENFEDSKQKYLSDKPSVKYALELCEDILYWKWLNSDSYFLQEMLGNS